MTEEIRNRILTEFQVSGEQKAEQAVNRLRQRTLEARVEARQATDVTEQWTRAMRGLERQRAIDNIAKSVVKATKDTRNWERAMKDVQLQLDRIGASSAEVEAIARRAAEAGAGGSRIRGLARQARVGLPSVPGVVGSLSSEQVVRLVEGLGAVDEAFARLGRTGKLAAAGIGVVAIALTALLADLKRRNDEAKAAAQAALGGFKTYYELIETGTQQTVEAGLKEAEARQRAAQATLGVQERILQGLEQNIDNAGIFARITAEAGVFASSIIGTQPELVATREAVENAKKEFNEATAAVDAHSRALESEALAARTAAEEQARLAEESRNYLQEQADRRILDVMETELSIRKQSADAIEDQIDALRAEEIAIRSVFENLLESGLSGTAVNQLSDRLNEIGRILPVLEEALPSKQRAEETARIFRESVDAVRAHDEAMLKLTESRAEREADIYGKLNDNLVKIAERAADATERTLQQLQNRRDDLARDLGRDFRDEQRKADLEALEERIKYQQQEAKSYRDHLRDLRRIREDAQAAEFDLVRNRDFTGLRDLRVETNRRLNEQNRAFIEERKERELAFAENVRDEQRQRQFERESRLLRYQDALDDAQIAADRELAQIQEKRQRELAAQQAAARQELALLNQKHRQEIVMRRDALTAELKLVAQGNAARLRMEEQFLFARAQLYRAGGIFGGLGNLLGGTTNNSSSYTNAPVFNVQTGGNASQTTQLVSLIENVVQRAFMQYARN